LTKYAPKVTVDELSLVRNKHIELLGLVRTILRYLSSSHKSVLSEKVSDHLRDRLSEVSEDVTPAEIRVSVAVGTIALTLRNLMFQGPDPEEALLRASSDHLQIGGMIVPVGIIIERLKGGLELNEARAVPTLHAIWTQVVELLLVQEIHLPRLVATRGNDIEVRLTREDAVLSEVPQKVELPIPHSHA
jgi:hypothetical protein